MSGLRYSSHHVVLEPGRWQVRVGDDVVTPEPKVFELLSYLMRHPGRVVTKAELLDSLWSGDVVGESVLTRCVSCARKLLADDSKTPRFIRTLHGRGYEFIAPVNALAEPGELREAAPANDGVDGASLPPVSQRDRPFIGRQPEAARLSSALRQLETRKGDFLLVSGEAGMGKTRLLEEVAAAAPPGVEVHMARCAAIEGAPAFLVWQQCLRSIVRARTLKLVLRAFEDAPSGARKLLLGTDRWQAEDQLGWDSPAERFRTFDAILRGLSELAAQRPLALLLDDLHAADLVSLLLLEFLTQASAAPILLIGATRDAEQLDTPRAEALARLRAGCKNELQLSGLSREEVRQFVGSRAPQGASDWASALLSRTGGNPFFLSVLTQSADATRWGEAGLPTAVHQAVSQRLAALDGGCVRLLRYAAVCGQSFDALVLARAADVASARCLELLANASAARVIAPAGVNEYRFVHDLIREVLASELSVQERPLVHLAVGRALEAVPSYRDARHAAALAHHFVAAAHVGGAANALDLSIRAGAYALRNLAYEAATEHFSQACRLLPLCESDPATECAVLLDLGLSQISMGEREAGRSTLQLAAEKARALGSGAELGAVALNLAPGLFAIETGVYDPVLVGLLREALAQTDADDHKRRALLLARLALALYWSDTYDERAAIMAEAGALAEHCGAEDVLASVLTEHSYALFRPDSLQERRRLSDRALELCLRVGDLHGQLLNRLLRSGMCQELMDLPGARFENDAFRAVAETVNQPQASWVVEAQRAWWLLLDGRLNEVEQLAGAWLVTGQRVRDHNALLTFGVHFTLVRIEQARAAEVLNVIRDYAARYPRIAGWRIMYTHALCHAAQLDAARAEYDSLARSAFAVPEDLNWMISMTWLADICRVMGDADGARVLYERLLPFAERFVVVGYGIVCHGSVERSLGLLAATFGDAIAATRHFEQALAKNTKASALLPRLQALTDYVIWLRECSGGDSARANELVQEAAPLIEARDLASLRQRLGLGP